LHILLPKHPTYPHKSISAIEKQHNVPLFSVHLCQYLTILKAGATKADMENSETQPLPFDHLDVFYSFKFSKENLDEAGELKDMVKASPLKNRFDTVVVLTSDQAAAVGYAGTRIGRVKVLFRLPTEIKISGVLYARPPAFWPNQVLAYIEWYTPLSLSKADQATHNMVSVQKAEGAQSWSIVPLSNIRQSCMLIPKFNKHTSSSQASWTSDTVLDSASSFLINNWTSIYSYQTLYK
jgi:hypothetical protein